MTTAEKLEALVQRGFDRGWEFDNLDKWTWGAIKKTDTVMNNWYYFLITHDGKEQFIDAERILYDHGFARALFGEELYCTDCRDFVGGKDEGPAKHTVLPYYQFNLQQAVISKDPIGYMYGVVFGGK
jgi:hypothetical protein